MIYLHQILPIFSLPFGVTLILLVTLLRYNGEDRETGEYHYHGYTALLDNLQAAVLDVKLRRGLEWIRHGATAPSSSVQPSRGRSGTSFGIM